eukprot:6465379-Amphidinium_carterae.1
MQGESSSTAFCGKENMQRKQLNIMVCSWPAGSPEKPLRLQIGHYGKAIGEPPLEAAKGLAKHLVRQQAGLTLLQLMHCQQNCSTRWSGNATFQLLAQAILGYGCNACA